MAWLPSGAINTEELPEYIPPEGGPLPQGVYVGMVVRTTQKETRNDGTMLEVEYDVKWPEQYIGRKFWDTFNLVNQSEQAAKIGRERLGNLAKAAGLRVLEDDEQLHGREVQAELYIKPAEEYIDKKDNQKKMGKPQNKIREYWPMGVDIEAAKKNRKPAAGAQPNAGSQPLSNQARPASQPSGGSKFPGTGAPPAASPQPSAQSGGGAPWKRS